LDHTIAQLRAGLLDFGQGRLVVLTDAVGASSQTQTRLLPIQKPSFSAVFWAFGCDFDDGNHTAVGLGDHLPDALDGQLRRKLSLLSKAFGVLLGHSPNAAFR
jgi:hypothetical protein